MTFQVLDGIELLDAAALVAREQVAARFHRAWMPTAYTDPEHCHVALDELLADGYVGFVAHNERGCVGVMCVDVATMPPSPTTIRTPVTPLAVVAGTLAATWAFEIIDLLPGTSFDR